MSETPMRVYELGFLLAPAIPETEVSSAIETLKRSITDNNGTVHQASEAEFIDLAYTIEKNVGSKKMKWSQAYFGSLKFDASPEQIESVKKILDANPELIRYIIVKTDLENAITFKKPKIEAKRASIDEEAVFEDVSEEDMQSDHEKLPDLEADIVEEVKGEEGEE